MPKRLPIPQLLVAIVSLGVAISPLAAQQGAGRSAKTAGGPLVAVTRESTGLERLSPGAEGVPPTVDAAIRKAEAHLQNGKRRYESGDMEAARIEFDLAVDALLSVADAGPGRTRLEAKLAETAEAIHQYDVSGLGAGEQDPESDFENSPLDEIPELTFPIDPKLRNQVAEELKATVSQLPLEVNDEVVRYIDYFSSGRGQKIFLNGMRRAGRYRAMIRRIFDEEGIPQELIHLAQAESGFSPKAVSRAQAVGMWQFILSRGAEYGLRRDKDKDERRDPEKATRAAARHLRDLYTKFGDWYLAMAAYNCGPLNVQRAVERTGYADFWELRRRNVLPAETSNYVPIILAMVILAKNPAHFNLPEVMEEPSLDYSTVELKAATHLDLVADVTGVPVAAIRDLNPSLLGSIAPAGHALHVPAGADASVLSALELIPPERRTSWRLYRTGEGDTLERIAARFHTTPKQIVQVNHALTADVEAGRLLVVPAAPAQAKVASKKRVSRKPAAAATRKKSAAAPKPAAAAKSVAAR